MNRKLKSDINRAAYRLSQELYDTLRDELTARIEAAGADANLQDELEVLRNKLTQLICSSSKT